jgi:hypothetical protein
MTSPVAGDSIPESTMMPNKDCFNDLTGKLHEVRRLRDLRSEVDRNLERTKADLLQAETELATEQANLPPEDLRDLKRTRSMGRVKKLNEDVLLLNAQKNGLTEKLRLLISELPACRTAVRNSLDTWAWKVAEEAEAWYRAKAAEFAQVMLRALGVSMANYKNGPKCGSSAD